MTLDLLPGLTYLLAVLFTITAVALVLSLTALATFVVDNRRVREARHETIPVYYRRLLLAH